jgi:hypothetical protein
VNNLLATDPLPPTDVTNRDLPSETLQNDADLVFRGVLPAGPSPDLPDESLGLLGRDLCYVGLTGVVFGHFRLLSRCGKSIPCTGSPNTPPPSCFSPFKSVPLSLNAYRFTFKGAKVMGDKGGKKDKAKKEKQTTAQHTLKEIRALSPRGRRRASLPPPAYPWMAPSVKQTWTYEGDCRVRI